ncbi:MAG TPA: hypothetical protein VKE40_16730, partial [Gemmataceae bacterium]|nr:hypothetical protein [Gemmataceae bacterium]
MLDLSEIPIIDNHLHPPLRAAGSPGEGDFRRLFVESDFAEQLDHVEHSLTFMRAVADLARLLGVDGGDWRAVRDARHALGPEGWYRRCLEGGNVRGLLVDYGYSTGDQLDHAELRALAGSAGAEVWPVYRLETALQ